MKKRTVKRKYPKKEWVLMKNGQLVRDSMDMPLLFSKEVALANVQMNKNYQMLKVGRDVILGKE